MGGTVITRRGNLVVDVENFTKRHLQRPLVVVVVGGGWCWGWLESQAQAHCKTGLIRQLSLSPCSIRCPPGSRKSTSQPLGDTTPPQEVTPVTPAKQGAPGRARSLQSQALHGGVRLEELAAWRLGGEGGSRRRVQMPTWGGRTLQDPHPMY